MNTDIEQNKKINTKLITPLIVLVCTAIIAIFTYFKRYPVSDWFVIVFASVVVFLIFGLIIEKMINRFIEVNHEKAMAEKAEAERIEEEARAAMEAEGGEEILDDEDHQIPSDF